MASRNHLPSRRVIEPSLNGIEAGQTVRPLDRVVTAASRTETQLSSLKRRLEASPSAVRFEHAADLSDDDLRRYTC